MFLASQRSEQASSALGGRTPGKPHGCRVEDTPWTARRHGRDLDAEQELDHGPLAAQGDGAPALADVRTGHVLKIQGSRGSLDELFEAFGVWSEPDGDAGELLAAMVPSA